MTDALLREVDADVRSERMRQMWRRYRRPLLIVVVLLIAVTAGASMWRDYQSKKAGEAMRGLDAAITQMENGDAKGAAVRFAALAEKSGDELRDIARLWQGRAQAESGEAAAAIKTLTDLAEHPSGSDLVWRDLACLRLLSANADAPKACATTSQSPLRAQRLEWQAALLWQSGKAGEARTLLQTIIDDEAAPDSQRDRARQLLRTLPARAA